MKTKIIISAFFAWIAITLLVVQQANAQKDFQDGFVITTHKDTLVGKVSNVHKNAHNFIDFLYPSGKDTIFTPNHISCYEIGNQRFIVVPFPHPTKADTTYLFAKVIVEGYANLYKTKIKTDPITPAEDAYLCKKYNETVYKPAGKISSLAKFFSDNAILYDELKNHPHLYSNNVETKIELFNNYNMWKKHELDSLASITHKETKTSVEKQRIEVFMKDSLNLSPESKFDLDKIASKMDVDPSLNMVCEFVKTSDSPKATQNVMKAVMKHLAQLNARIEEKITSSPENQQIVPSKAGAQIIYYYFR